jgi:hypothetical protein
LDLDGLYSFYVCWTLFNLSFFEQDTPSHDRIKLDETDLIHRSTDIFACRVEKSRPCCTGQLDGNGLAAAAGHLECRCGVHVNETLKLFTEDYRATRVLLDYRNERLSRETREGLVDLFDRIRFDGRTYSEASDYVVNVLAAIVDCRPSID